MVDRGEHPGKRETGGDLPRRGGEAGEEERAADAEEEHHHHPVAAPMVGEPPRRNGEGAEGDEATERERQRIRVLHVPGGREHQHDRRKDQHDEMVEQVPEIEKGNQPGVGSHGMLGIAHGTKLTP
jgi:hypothetical protein